MKPSEPPETEGGDAPCWAHLFADAGGSEIHGASVVTPDQIEGSGGVVWTNEASTDLNVNIVRLDSSVVIGEHVNDDVDVVMVIQAGTCWLSVEGSTVEVVSDQVAHIPKGVSRSVTAGAHGVTYLSIHRRRRPLEIAGP